MTSAGRLTALCASAVLILAASAGVDGPLKTGEPPPPFQLENLDGHVVSVSQFSGQVVSIHFFAVWCEPCLAELPEIEKAAARYRGRGYQPLLVAVSHRQDPRRLREFVKGRALELPVLFDGQDAVQQLYGVRGLPMNVLLGRDGRIRYWGNSLPVPFLEQVGRLVADRAP